MNSQELMKLLLSSDEDKAVTCKAHVPYDGCFWEPNYWLYLGERKTITPLYVSGKAYNAFELNTIREAVEVGLTKIPLHDFVTILDELGDYDEWEVYDLRDLDPNPNYLNSITAILALHDFDAPVWRCSECREEKTGYAHFLGYRGNGGIGIFLTNICCPECFKVLHWCEGCCNTVRPEDGLCPDCGEECDHELHPLTIEDDDEAYRWGFHGHQFRKENDQ